MTFPSNRFLLRCGQLLLAATFLLGMGACQHAKFRSENGGSAMPWATPEGFENSGAGTPFGLMQGMQGR
jgi:hypothetical protein